MTKKKMIVIIDDPKHDDDAGWLEGPVHDEDEGPVEKSWREQPRHEAGTEERDSTGDRAGGQWQSEEGGGVQSSYEQLLEIETPQFIKDFIRSAKGTMAEESREILKYDPESENGPNNEFEVPHRPNEDDWNDVPRESTLDYSRYTSREELERLGLYHEKEIDAIMAYQDALHSPTLPDTGPGPELLDSLEHSLMTMEMNMVGFDIHHEFGYAIGEKGGIRGRFEGDEESIFVPDSERWRIKDAYFTHVHPVERPLSPGDILMGIKDNNPEIRAISPLATYRMVRPEGGWPDMWKVDAWVYGESDQILRAVRQMGMNTDVHELPLTAVENVKLQHTLLMRMAEHFEMTYVREPHDVSE